MTKEELQKTKDKINKFREDALSDLDDLMVISEPLRRYFSQKGGSLPEGYDMGDITIEFNHIFLRLRVIREIIGEASQKIHNKVVESEKTVKQYRTRAKQLHEDNQGDLK